MCIGGQSPVMQQSSETDISSKDRHVPHVTLVNALLAHKTRMKWYHFLPYRTYISLQVFQPMVIMVLSLVVVLPCM